MFQIHTLIKNEDKANTDKKLIAVDHSFIDFRILSTQIKIDKLKGKPCSKVEKEMADMNGFRLADFT